MPGLFGQPDVRLALAQPLGHPTPVVPMPFWLILSFWPWLLAMPQTNSCAPSWPFQIPVSLVPLPFTLTPPSLTPQHHNSDHDTLDAYCLRFSPPVFSQWTQRATVYPIQMDMCECLHLHWTHTKKVASALFWLGTRLLRCFSPFTIDQDWECYPLFKSFFVPN